MIITEALRWAKNKLSNIDSPQLDAEVLLSFVLKKNKTFLYTYPEKKLSKPQTDKFKILIKQRAKNIPSAYLTKQKEFFGLNFYVDKRVLIPRPETEIIVEQASELIKKYKLKSLADIGTGSGCIAITLKKLFPKLKVLASDISLPALAVAKKNARLNKVRIQFKKGDLLTPYKHLKIDILVANLPYLSQEIYNSAKTIKHEPKTALFAKKQGLEYIENTIKQIVKLNIRAKFLLLEIDPSQSKKLKKKLNKLNYQVTITKDLQKLDRTLTITY